MRKRYAAGVQRYKPFLPQSGYVTAARPAAVDPALTLLHLRRNSIRAIAYAQQLVKGSTQPRENSSRLLNDPTQECQRKVCVGNLGQRQATTSS